MYYGIYCIFPNFLFLFVLFILEKFCFEEHKKNRS